MRYKIRPIGYEDNDPVKIRAALKAGCGGVIVPQNISDIVTAEIDAVKARADEYPDMIEKFRMTWHGADKKYPAHHWSKPQESLTHTYRWLEDIWARAVSQRLVRPPVPGISSNLVAL